MTEPAPPPPDTLARARRYQRGALLALLLPAAATAAGAWVLARDARPAAVTGLLLGHGAGLAIGLSWLLSAFRAPGAFAFALWPLRMLGLFLVLGLGLLLRADPHWLTGALLLSILYAQFLYIAALCSPAAAADPEAPPPRDDADAAGR